MDWKSILGSAAPIIATALGGPLGGLAVSAAADALGLSEKTEQAIKDAISGATPEQLEALKRADYEFALKRTELEQTYQLNLATIEAGDRASARQREVTTGDHITPRILAAVVVLGFFGVLTLMIFNELPPAGRDSLLVLVGALGAAFGAIVNYYFGSSSGSAAKQRQIEAITGRG